MCITAIPKPNKRIKKISAFLCNCINLHNTTFLDGTTTQDFIICLFFLEGFEKYHYAKPAISMTPAIAAF
jgi:hypothetical protein